MIRGFWTGIPAELLISGSNVSSPRLAPNGKYLAYLQGTKKGNHVFLYDIKAMTTQQLTYGSGLSTGTPYGGGVYCWSEDSQFIYFSSKGGLYRIPSQGGELEKIDAPDLCFAPSHMKNKLIFSVEHEDHMSLGLLDTDDLKNTWPSRIPITENFLYDAILHPNGTKLAVHSWSFPNMSWNGSQIEILESQDNFQTITRTVVGGGKAIATSQPKWSPNGNFLAFLSDENGWLNLWVTDKDGSNSRPIVKEDYEHAYSTWTTGESNYVWLDDNRIIFTRNDNGFFSLVLVFIDTGKTVPLGFKDGMFKELSRNSNQLALYFTDYETRGQIMLFELDNLKEDEILNPRVIADSGVKVPQNLFCKPRKIEFPTASNQTCHALIYSMGDEEDLKDAPVIVNVHGGPTGMRTNSWDYYAQYFASRGFLFIELNYRGSIGYGREYRESLNEKWGILDVEDSVHLLEYLKKEKMGDTSKATIMGGSAGGFTVLMALAKRPGTFKAGIDLFGVSDNFTLAADTHYLESRYTDTLVGPLPEGSERYYEQSPIYFAEKIVDPLLILQGEDDPVVVKGQSEIILTAVSGIVESKFYEGEGHGFQKFETIKDALDRIEKFIKKHVLYKKPNFMK